MICHNCQIVMDKWKNRIYECPKCHCMIFIPYFVDIKELEEEDAKKEKELESVKKSKKCFGF